LPWSKYVVVVVVVDVAIGHAFGIGRCIGVGATLEVGHGITVSAPDRGDGAFENADEQVGLFAAGVGRWSWA
jgi:hypothetical protein